MPDAATDSSADPAKLRRQARMALDSMRIGGIAHVRVKRKAKTVAPAASVRAAAKPSARQASAPAPAGPQPRPATSTPAKLVAPIGQPVIVASAAAAYLESLPGERAKTLARMAHDVATCAQCGLCSSRIQTVFSRGNPNSPLMFVGEAPGADEDASGLPFVGRAGQLLDDIISKGMKYAPEDIYIANVLKCRPPQNRNPEPEEIEACRGYLTRQIEIVDPLVIVAMGRFGAQWIMESELPIGRLRGRIYDVKGRKVVCTYHPAYLLRNPAAKAEVWKDVQLVMDFFGRGKPLPMRV